MPLLSKRNKEERVMLITKKFSFDSAHKLHNYRGKCQFLHGHTYLLYVTVKGQKNEKTGLVIDFKTIKEVVEKKVLQFLDHQYLNKVLKQPTAENIAVWIWERLEKELNLFKIEIWETQDSCIEYYG